MERPVGSFIASLMRRRFLYFTSMFVHLGLVVSGKRVPGCQSALMGETQY